MFKENRQPGRVLRGTEKAMIYKKKNKYAQRHNNRVNWPAALDYDGKGPNQGVMGGYKE